MPLADQHAIAVYPGSFDPVTFGHLDIIKRASRLFSEVVVGIGVHPAKSALFSPEERLDLLLPNIVDLPNVRAAAYQKLTTEFVQEMNAQVILRGIRDVNDLSHEIRQASVNMMIGGIETIFMLTSDEFVLTSSTYIRQIFEMAGGEPIRRLVPENVVEALTEKLGAK